TYPGDSVQNKYQIGSGAVLNYTGPITLSENASIVAYAVDAAGNTSGNGTLTVNNIDKIAPSAPTLIATPTTPTNGNVSVTIIYPDDSVQNKYQIGSGAVLDYTGPITLSENASIVAYAVDAAGNTSGNGTLTVSNIDKIAPSAPTLIATPTTPTNGNVSVTIMYPNDSVQNKYQIGSGAVLDYTNPITLSVNDSVYAYAVDAAGNTSVTGTLTVDNIDKVAPSTPVLTADIINPTNSPVRVTMTNWGDAITKEYRLNEGEWQSALESSEAVMLSNGTIEARGIDSAGNVSPIGWIEISNIVEDQGPLQVTLAAINSDGTQMTIQFNNKLDTQAPLNKEKFRLNGTATSISNVSYASDQVVVLQLSSPEVETNELQQITLDMEFGAVVDQGSNLILELRGLPIKSQTETNTLREQLQSFASNPNGTIKMNNIVRYMLQSAADITGDSVFDQNDLLFLLLQIDRLNDSVH
ncbi:MAG: coagulation factor 5/8 type domain protein, partial [Paenibacillus sp.]|nr:coagulation factor 5/8 type domain protein [Paenibacillus sp.]